MNAPSLTDALMAGAAGSVSVLVVDDDDDTSSLVGLCLEREGWQATLVSTVQAAKEALATGCFHVLLTDLHLEDGEGTELMRMPRPSGLRVAILMSGSSRPDPSSRRGAHSFDATMSKPIDRAAMVSTIRRLLACSERP